MKNNIILEKTLAICLVGTDKIIGFLACNDFQSNQKAELKIGSLFRTLRQEQILIESKKLINGKKKRKWIWNNMGNNIL